MSSFPRSDIIKNYSWRNSDMSTIKLGDDWNRRLSGAIISCGFFPVLRRWYLYCWIRKQPKCESPDTQSRLLTCMNKNMQFLCPHAIASHRHSHTFTDLIHAQQSLAWHVFTFQTLSTRARASGRRGLQMCCLWAQDAKLTSSRHILTWMSA